MKTFKGFLMLEARGFMSASGRDSEDHIKKYIQPHIGSEEYTHTLGKEHDELPAGTKLKLTGVFRYLDGKAHVNAIDHVGEKHIIPISKIHKYGEAPPNKGIDYESKFVERLKHHKLMPEHLVAAGSTGGTDFAIENKKTKKFHAGTVSSSLLNGETKNGTTAALGQLTIHHKEEKGGWHIPDSSRKRWPEFAKHVEQSGILEAMNKHQPNPKKVPTTKSGLAQDVTLKHPNLDPAKGYFKDKDIDVFHMGGYGTYSGREKDVTGHGLPQMSGKGKWVSREKQRGNKFARTVAFHVDGVNGLNKSHVDLDNDDHLFDFKKSLGFKD